MTTNFFDELQADDEMLTRFARLLTQNVLLLREADSAGIRPSALEWKGLERRYLAQLDTLKTEMGLAGGDLTDTTVAAAERQKVAGLKMEGYFDKLIAGQARLRPLPSALLAPLGLGAGFLDAVGGGGWGPVGTPTLLASGRMEPRKVIGSVDTGEFLVALGASLGFLVSLSWRQVPVTLVLLLLAGGLVAAPLAAWLVRRLAPRKLGVIVGAAILLTNFRTLASTFGIEGAWRAASYLAIVAVVGALAAWRLAQSRQRRRAAVLAPRPLPTPEPVGA